MEYHEQVQSKVVEMLSGKGNQPGQPITPETHLINDLGFDSLEVVEFMMKIEDEFGITVPDEEAQKLMTVKLIVGAIVERTEQKSAP